MAEWPRSIFIVAWGQPLSYLVSRLPSFCYFFIKHILWEADTTSAVGDQFLCKYERQIPPTNLGRSYLKLSDSSSDNLVVIKVKFYHAGSMLLQSSTKQINNSQLLNTSLNNLEYVIRRWLKTPSFRQFSSSCSLSR